MQEQESIGAEEVSREEAARRHNAAHDERKRVRHAAIRMHPLAAAVRHELAEMRRGWQRERVAAMIADGERRAARYGGLAGVSVG